VAARRLRPLYGKIAGERAGVLWPLAMPLGLADLLTLPDDTMFLPAINAARTRRRS
jgi:hypothetical protein